MTMRLQRLARAMRVALWIGIVAFTVAAVWATRLGTRWPSVYFMTGPSMEPTIAAEEYFFTWRSTGNIRPGDLVIFKFEDEDGVYDVLRRVVALTGDTVAMVEGAVVLNGVRQDWAFVIHNHEAWHSQLALVENLYDWGPWIVPEDSVVLLSDTRDMLGWPDSRFIGFVARGDIIAEATRTVTGRKLR